MHEYGDSDNSTPQSLLEEAVAYAREILGDLGRAPVAQNKKFPNVSSVKVECVTSETPDNIRKIYKESGTLTVERDSYETSHPAITESFRSAVKKLMEESGFVAVEQGQGYGGFQQNNFATAGTESMTSIAGFSVAFNGPAEKVRAALAPTEDTLRLACLDALNEGFAAMSVLKTPQLRRNPGLN